MDIFGVSDYTTSPECVACLTEPRDTILLPCRHLCVCSSCFELLTLDRCPVCRAPFQSYLRFTGPDPPASADVAPSSAVSEAPSAPSEAPSTEPFLPPDNAGSSYQLSSIEVQSDPLGVSGGARVANLNRYPLRTRLQLRLDDTEVRTAGRRGGRRRQEDAARGRKCNEESAVRQLL